LRSTNQNSELLAVSPATFVTVPFNKTHAIFKGCHS
jgi:hypothetical protein